MCLQGMRRMDRDSIINIIYETFGTNDYPGEDFLLGSTEGREPYEEVEPFKDLSNWTTIESEFLDRHSGALNFFSEAGLRFFLPAFLIADLNDELQSADPLFTLIHGFSDLFVEHKIGSRTFFRKTGKNSFINPLRYGSMTYYDHAIYRLSVFAREEAKAIVLYLRYKQFADKLGVDNERIQAALDLFWVNRAENAPSIEEIRIHMKEEQAYLTALNRSDDDLR